MEQAWKYPARKFIGVHLGGKIESILGQVQGQVFLEELGAIIQRFRGTDGALDQLVFLVQ